MQKGILAKLGGFLMKFSHLVVGFALSGLGNIPARFEVLDVQKKLTWFGAPLLLPAHAVFFDRVLVGIDKFDLLLVNDQVLAGIF